jgi:hypothetical protein
MAHYVMDTATLKPENPPPPGTSPSAARPITTEEWDALSLDQKRRLIRMFVERVEVKRSPKGKKSGPKADFTKGRVKIVPVSLRLVAAANE